MKAVFWIDLAATIPFDKIISAVKKDSSPQIRLLGLFKIGRMFKIRKIIQFLNLPEDIKQFLNLGKLIFFLIIYLHLYACLWWLLIKDD